MSTSIISLLFFVLVVSFPEIQAYPGGAPYAQNSFAQFNVLKHQGGHGPFSVELGFGIDRAPPENCIVEQAQVYMRHGERYPTKNLGRSLTAVIKNIQNITANNRLSFLNSYTSPALDSSNYDNETTTGPYSGFASMFLLGGELRRQYGHLWNRDEVLPIFAAGQERVVVSAQNAARGFFGNNWKKRAHFVVLKETLEQGLNSLTPNIGCPLYNGSYKSDYITKFAEIGLDPAYKRLVADLPGTNLTHKDVSMLMSLCFYDLNVAGTSPWCDYFTENDWVAFEYFRDLDYYYNAGPGNPLGQAIGSVVANASLALLLQQSNLTNSSALFLNFVHDTNLFAFMTAFGIALPSQNLSWEQAVFPNLYSQLTPMGARLNLEKLVCMDSGVEQRYVRFVINEAVFPFPYCASGPGFSCPLENYIEIQNSRLQDTIKACGITSDYSYPKNLTFYWDWKTNPEKYVNVNDVSPSDSF